MKVFQVWAFYPRSLAGASAAGFVKFAWKAALATLSAGLLMLLAVAICRLANTSPGNNSTGSLFTWAKPAAVTMFKAPGPIEEVTAIARLRFSCLE